MPIRTTIALLLTALMFASCKTGNMMGSLADAAAALTTTLDQSKSRQRKLGDAAAVHINKNHLRSDDRALEAYLNQMTQKLATAAGAADYTYRLYLLEDAQVNAFTPGGGHIFVTTGLMRALENEGQMAAVIAHEIGHVTESHVVRGIRDKLGIQVAAKAGAQAIGIEAGITRQIYDYSVLAAANGHGRQFELKADYLGLDTMIKAGYHPDGALGVFEALRRLYGDRSELATFFHGSHLTNVERIKALRDRLSKQYSGFDTSGLIRETAAYRRFKARYRSQVAAD